LACNAERKVSSTGYLVNRGTAPNAGLRPPAFPYQHTEQGLHPGLPWRRPQGAPERPVWNPGGVAQHSPGCSPRRFYTRDDLRGAQPGAEGVACRTVHPPRVAPASVSPGGSERRAAPGATIEAPTRGSRAPPLEPVGWHNIAPGEAPRRPCPLHDLRGAQSGAALTERPFAERKATLPFALVWGTGRGILPVDGGATR
jgi:hypothetical protein